jgi:hypothetical protein
MLAGCGGGGGNGGHESAPRMPACAGAGPAVRLPANFPRGFPLPPGTVVTSTRRQSGGVVVDGIVPDGLDGTRRFLLRKLPEAGFRLSGGEAEENEAETDFAGAGVVGRLKVREIDGCAGAVTLTVGVVRRR